MDNFDNDHVSSKFTGFKKFSRNQWTLIEKEIDINMKKVIQVLCNLGGDNNVDNFTLQTIKNVYEKIRPLLIENNLIQEQKDKNKNNKNKNNNNQDNQNNINIDKIIEATGVQKQNKLLNELLNKYNIPTTKNTNKNNKKKIGLNKDQMIENNIVTNITTLINNLLEVQDGNFISGFRSTYAEMKLVTFLFYIKYYLINDNESECYELIIGITKLLNNIFDLKNKLNDIKQKIIIQELLNNKNKQKSDINLSNLIETYENNILFDNINLTLCNDLKYMCDILKSKIKFNFKSMFCKYPRLCLSTNYDNVFPNMHIKPYPSQVELIEKLKQSIYNDNFNGLYMYRAMVNSGKTMNAVAVGKLVQNVRLKNMNKEQSRLKKVQLLFSCSVEPVRIEVAKVLFHAKIPFGIASTGDDGSLKIINNYNCQKKDENRIVIVADLESTLLLLSSKNQELAEQDLDFKNYVLFLDEPTLGADIEDHPITRMVMQIILNAPKCTILSSATLPDINDIPDVINHYKTKNPESEIYDIYSKNALIGCHVICNDGTSVTPYMNCYNKTTLQNTIEILKTKPFIDRLLSAPIVYDLQNKMLEEKINDVIDLEKHFGSCYNLCQTEIQNVGIQLLERLLLENDDIIKNICSKPVKLDLLYPKQNQNDLSKDDSDSDGFDWSDDETVIDDNSGIITNPYDINYIFTKYAHKFNGPCLVADMDPYKFTMDHIDFLIKKCPKAHDLINQYNMDVLALEEYKEKLEKEPKKVSKEERKLILEEKRAKMKLLENKCPRIKFPNIYKINTIYHTRYFAKEFINDEIIKNSRASFSPETLDLDLNIPDWLMLSLFSGIGIYSNLQNNKNYNETVLELARNKQLAFLVSDDSICYGTNYPFSHLHVSDNIAEKHSINTLFQLFGRVGRVGESWSATIVISDYIKNILLNYNMNDISIEANNINKVFKKLTTVKKPKQKIKTQIYLCSNGKDIDLNNIKQPTVDINTLPDLSNNVVNVEDLWDTDLTFDNIINSNINIDNTDNINTDNIINSYDNNSNSNSTNSNSNSNSNNNSNSNTNNKRWNSRNESNIKKQGWNSRNNGNRNDNNETRTEKKTDWNKKNVENKGWFRQT